MRQAVNRRARQRAQACLTWSVRARWVKSPLMTTRSGLSSPIRASTSRVVGAEMQVGEMDEAVHAEQTSHTQ
jgi:hypothetical protein